MRIYSSFTISLHMQCGGREFRLLGRPGYGSMFRCFPRVSFRGGEHSSPPCQILAPLPLNIELPVHSTNQLLVRRPPKLFNVQLLSPLGMFLLNESLLLCVCVCIYSYHTSVPRHEGTSHCRIVLVSCHRSGNRLEHCHCTRQDCCSHCYENGLALIDKATLIELTLDSCNLYKMFTRYESAPN